MGIVDQLPFPSGPLIFLKFKPLLLLFDKILLDLEKILSLLLERAIFSGERPEALLSLVLEDSE